jgi:hypothetical protein
VIRKILNTNFVVDSLDSLYNPWRRGRIGKMAGRHSPTGHVTGKCWCGEGLKKTWDVGQSFAWGMFQVDLKRNRIRAEEKVQRGAMTSVRRWVYRQGFRPKKHNPFYSPTLSVLYSYTDGLFGEKAQILFKKR